jgi:hypothetical protein
LLKATRTDYPHLSVSDLFNGLEELVKDNLYSALPLGQKSLFPYLYLDLLAFSGEPASFRLSWSIVVAPPFLSLYFFFVSPAGVLVSLWVDRLLLVTAVMIASVGLLACGGYAGSVVCQRCVSDIASSVL